MQWFHENKRWIGAAFAALGAGLLYLGYVEAAGLVALVGTHLGLSGVTRSDREARLDRR
jgi:hypothetical protein